QIQKPFYRYRPVVGMQEDLKLAPQTYEDNEGGAVSSISGNVTDANGATVAGASVTFTNTATNQSFSTMTGSDGSYNSSTLMPGTYSVTVNSPGFKRHRIENVVVG